MSEAMQATEAVAAPEAVGAVLGGLMGDVAAAAGVILTEQPGPARRTPAR